jgi:hypothetical protein
MPVPFARTYREVKMLLESTYLIVIQEHRPPAIQSLEESVQN